MKKIVFFFATPPFEHGKTEQEYLRYDDWFSELRRMFAVEDHVIFASLTRKKKEIKIEHHGYMALFFPVDNYRQGRQCNGRLFYKSSSLIKWIREFEPDVLHVNGTGSVLSSDLLDECSSALKILWERNKINDEYRNWPEIYKCDYYLHPTEASIKKAIEELKVNPSKLVLIPLGAGMPGFEPLRDIYKNKKFDIITIGVITHRKGYDAIREMIYRNNWSWVHLGGYFKGGPYSKFSDIVFSGFMRRLGLVRGLKFSKDKRYACGIARHRDVPKILNSARVFVHPALQEGAARAVQEALTCSVPVIVREEAVPWVREDFGIKFNNESQIEDSIEKFLALDDFELRRRGALGREWLLKNHGISVLFKKIKEIHESG